MDNASEVALGERKLFSSTESSMCGVELEVGELYVIAGRTEHINHCNYIRPYKYMTIVERRGFAHRYAKGCQCRVCLFNKNIIDLRFMLHLHNKC